MNPCYILTYYEQGPCAVDVNSVTDTKDLGQYCLLGFNDGSTLKLEENCEAYDLKKATCRPASGLPDGIKRFPG